MGEIRKPKPVVLFTAVSGRDHDALQWARTELEQKWGQVRFSSEPFDFCFTEYYRQQMGDSIVKQFLAFRDLIDPAEIVAAKLYANEREKQYGRMLPTLPKRHHKAVSSQGRMVDDQYHQLH